MAAYRLLIKPSAAKELEAVGTKRDRQRIVGRIQSLASAPRLEGSEKLAGTSPLFRIRQGSWRIIYAIDDARATAEIIKIGHRREVYRSV